MDLGSFVQFPTRRNALASTSTDAGAYSIPERDWPSAIQVLPHGLTALPRKVVEGGNTANIVCRLGVLPEVDMAWSSVDSTLYLWRLGTSGNIMLERTVPGVISCVAIVKPKPGVFMDNIKYILVVCTCEEVSMVGLIFDKYGTSIEVQELTYYTCPLDGVRIHSVIGTKQGRIFMGSVEGVVYELYYNKGSGFLWPKSHCRKGAINGNMLFPFLKDGRSIIQLLVDDLRMILYSLDDDGRIQAYDLGPKGDSGPKNFAQCTNFFAQASNAISGRDIFATASNRRVVSLSIIPRSESRELSLMAMTSDGYRVYFSHVRPESGDWFSGLAPKAELKVLFVHSAPQPTDLMGAAGRGTVLCERDSSVFQSVSFSGGVLLAVSADNETASTRIAAYLTAANQEGSNSEMMQTTGLREQFIHGAVEVEGTAVEIVELKGSPHQSELYISNHGEILGDELSAQIFRHRLRFGLVTSRCSAILEKSWPVDILATMLAENNLNAVRAFFTAHGQANAAAMCFQLAASPPEGVHRDVSQAAARLLSNKFFGGEPKLVAAGGEQDSAHGPGWTRNVSNFLIETGTGSAIQGSAAFHGLKLYVVRLVEPLWRDKLFKEGSGGKLVMCNLSSEMIEWYARRCHDGAAATDLLLKRWGQKNLGSNISSLTSSPQQVETSEVLKARYLLKRAGDVMGFLRVLLSQNLNRIMARLSPELVEGLKTLKMMDVVLEENLGTPLEALIIEMTSETREWSDIIINRLNAEALSFFSKNKVTYLKAFRSLQAAVSSQSMQGHNQKRDVKDAVALMKTVPQEVDLPVVADALYSAGFIEACVTICLTVAAACDTEHHSENMDTLLEQPRLSSRKDMCFEILFKAVDRLLQIGNADGRPGKWSQDLERLLQAVKASKNHEFFVALLEEFGGDRLGGSYLITILDTPEIAEFLRKKAGMDRQASFLDTMTDSEVHHMKLYAKYLSGKDEHFEAAQLYRTLADRRPAGGGNAVDLEERLLMLNRAQNQMCCIGGGCPEIDDSIKIMELQIRLRDHLQTMADTPPELAKGPIQTQVLGVSEIVDIYAVPHKLYSFVLEASSFIDDKISPKQFRGLWQLYLKSAWEDSDESIVEVCDVVNVVGKRLASKPICFPSGYICFLLESLILGIWPRMGGARRPQAQEKSLIHDALFFALGGVWSNVIKAYRDCLRNELGDVQVLRARRPPQLQLEVLKSMTMVLDQIWPDPYFPFDDGEKGLTGGMFVRFLDECLLSASELRRSINPAEVDSLVTSLQEVKRMSHEKCKGR